jgi:exportin-2 (importin alpha re-exporter)
VAKPARHRALFASPQTLQQICEKVILPNMALRTTDLEDFEDDPLGYVRRELEGSDAETRRRAAGDLVRGLLEGFEKQVTDIFGKYVSSYLTAYEGNRAKNFLQKDTALYLLTSLSARSVAASTGATKINENIRTLDVFTTNILPDLQDDPKLWPKGVNPIVKVGCLKYILMFRTQLSRSDLLGIMPFLVHHLDHPNPVVYTYAAVCIERILAMKHATTAKLEFVGKDIQSFAPILLEKLFGLIERSGSALQPAKLAENDYLMKCIMRTVMTLRGDVVPFAGTIINKLTSIIGVISSNPSNPKFNHYAFETLGGMVRFVCPGNADAVKQFEELLMPSFQGVLSHDVQEFMPYVFQILSQLLEFHTTTPAIYQTIFPTLLQTNLWDSHGNIPPLVRLLQAYLEKGGRDIVASGKLTPMLGIYQKLIASKLNDTHGFELLNSIFDHVPAADLTPYLKHMVVLLLNRLQKFKTAKFTRGFLMWCMHVINSETFGPEALLQLFDSIQPNLFSMVLGQILVAEISQVVSMEERNVVLMGMIKLFPHLLKNPAYQSTLTPLLSALANLLVVPEAQDAGNEFEDELAALEMEESAGYQASFTRLATVGKKKRDVGNGKQAFKQGFAALMASNPNEVKILSLKANSVCR